MKDHGAARSVGGNIVGHGLANGRGHRVTQRFRTVELAFPYAEEGRSFSNTLDADCVSTGSQSRQLGCKGDVLLDVIFLEISRRLRVRIKDKKFIQGALPVDIFGRVNMLTGGADEPS